MKDRMFCKVLSNVEIAKDIHKLEIERIDGFGEIKPGQFLHIKCGGEGLLLRRPISISYIEKDRIGLIIRRAGKGTKLLCDKKVGETLDVLGPLGNGFSIDDEVEKVIVIGGGIGTAPLLELVKSLKGKDIAVLLGYRDEPYLVDDFEQWVKGVKVATEDGSFGYKGYVTDLLEEEIKNNRVDIIYACGPEIMLKKVQDICNRYKKKSQLSIEERMACGVGACLVCTCKVKAEEKGVKYVRTCKDGPVFWGDEVMFHE
ncbi:dihydroorotate dehydrogenase electron transfer subunit [Crassaminicella thermophila]|uniref:Dihydroorotate dehydrogenase B (NAD(+)), electron transfer subunit n=1 Tax=Crassaminicella thermophila TaxID=2599308 RepID=A0A5C0SHH8_CRATE|nr:dihydroorotate dehydrogenase electron transfer subunit [Crassaminicella thermophila]QEK13186.1 dihydroorotate dehydrogenase electron transfer subunit [Crassaminicella thermophila]